MIHIQRNLENVIYTDFPGYGDGNLRVCEIKALKKVKNTL